VPETQPAGELRVKVTFDSGPLAGALDASAKVEVVKGTGR
jgi:hypothetical protein